MKLITFNVVVFDGRRKRLWDNDQKNYLTKAIIDFVIFRYFWRIMVLSLEFTGFTPRFIVVDYVKEVV